MRRQNKRLPEKHRHRREVPDGIERKLGIQARIRSERARDEKHRVAVGWRFDYGLCADVAGRTRPVLDDHLLPPAFTQLLAEETRYEIRRSARGVRNDASNRLAGIVLSERLPVEREQVRDEQ